MEDVSRGAARVLVLTPEPQVLLLRLEPAFRDPFWVTPGGGLDDGETYEDAAVTVFPDAEPIAGSGWFTVERLRAEPETVYPVGLASHLERLLADGHGEQPVDLGIVAEG